MITLHTNSYEFIEKYLVDLDYAKVTNCSIARVCSLHTGVRITNMSVSNFLIRIGINIRKRRHMQLIVEIEEYLLKTKGQEKDTILADYILYDRRFIVSVTTLRSMIKDARKRLHEAGLISVSRISYLTFLVNIARQKVGSDSRKKVCNYVLKNNGEKIPITLYKKIRLHKDYMIFPQNKE